MAFSESFGLGNSTFMDLESEVNKALQLNPKKPTNDEGAQKSNANPLDIIDESPTNSKGKPNKSRSRHHVSQFGVQRRKKFQKSKSDSTLNQNSSVRQAGAVTNRSKDDNYSEFFKSEFSIEEDRSTKNKVSSFVTTSQIEAAMNQIDDRTAANGVAPPVHFAFEDSKMFSEMIGDLKTQHHESAQEESMNTLDIPVFSEDLKLLNDSSIAAETSLKATHLSENHWMESLKLSDLQEDPVFNVKISSGAAEQGEVEVAEEVFNVDDATFICPDDQGKDFAEKTINEIKTEMQDEMSQEYSQKVNSSNGSVMEKSILKLSIEMPNNFSKEAIKSATNSSAAYEMKCDLEELKRISAWNLPSSVLKEYEKKGISKMFDWQIECLRNPKVLFEHCNLVYSAPTSAGKTLVSEILLIKTILERGKKVIMILPFISVVREKMFYLQDLLTPSGYRVEGFFGGYTPPGGFDSINVAICTIEKANSIVNKLLERGKLDEIGTFVVDEIHLISDPGRGYILELLLAKVLYMSRKYSLQIQIITMSATLANVELLKKWLNAELFITNYRPVALQEMIKIGTKIYDNNLEFLREINSNGFDGINDKDHVAQLCIETLAEGCSVVVFCPSKDWCENLSVQLAAAIHAIGRSGSEIGNKLRANIKRDAVEEVKKQLKDIPTGLDSVLEKTINYACAFHHAGLTTEERDIIESCFKSGALKVIVATSTLSSGVNLPARRVIIRSPLFGGKQMSSLTYKQMIGRAGRTGKDTLGESILICTDSNARIGKCLVSAAINPICSCLEMESSTHLKRALLEVISSSVATSKTDILNFVACTLLNTQKEIAEAEKNDGSDEGPNQNFIFDSIDFLIEYEFIRKQLDEEKGEDNFVATRLGMACLASSMPPTDGLILFSELQKSRRCFVLESELHAVYLVTPYSVCYQLQDLDWLMYLDLWEKLSPAMKKVGELVGVKESFLVRAMRGQIKLDYKLMQVHKRFYTALALQELVNETPVNAVAAKFKCNRGMLQSLQQMASTFAGIVTAFCNSLNWSMLALIVGQFKERLFFGVHRDLIDLMRLPDLNYKRARALFDAGIASVVDLANADANSVEKILHDSLSFDTAKKLDNENEYEKNQRNNFRNLYITGKTGLTVMEAAKMLVTDARQFVQYEIGVGNINWSMAVVDGGGEVVNSKRKSNVGSSDASPPKIKKHEEDWRCANENTADCKQVEVDKSGKPAYSKGPGDVNSKNKSEGLKILRDIPLNFGGNQDRPVGSSKNAKLIPSKEVAPYAKDGCINQVKTVHGNKASEEQRNKNVNACSNRIEQTKEYERSRGESREKIVSRISGEIKGPSNSKEGNTIAELTEKVDSDCLKNAKIDKKGENSKENIVSLKMLNATQGKATLMRQKNQALEGDSPAQNAFNSNNCASKNSKTTGELAERRKLSSDGPKNTKIESKEENYKKNTVFSKMTNATHGKPLAMRQRNQAQERDSPALKAFSSNDCPTKVDKAENVKRSSTESIASFQTKETQIKHLKPLGNEANLKASLKKPIDSPSIRRSPRNHLPTSTRIDKPSNSKQQPPLLGGHQNDNDKDDLFMDETSFEMNSAIANAMEADNKCEQQQQPPRRSLNKSSDEIAASQELTFEPKTQSTRYLRSYKEQTKSLTKTLLRRTPPRRKSEQDSSPAPLRAPPPPQTNKSSTMEVSDVSLGNSLMQNPIQLNSSHILSTSKTEPDALSLDCIQIVDICGSQMLFKNAIKELTAAKLLGFAVGVEKQTNKQKPLIGANLLINQVDSKDSAATGTQHDFVIDDASYVAGISMVISENVSFYLNLQAENTGKGVTKEMKIEAIRTLAEDMNLTLQIFDSKEQLKVLRKAIPSIGKLQGKVEDPKVANWLLQPDKTMSFANMAQQFAPECKALVKLSGNSRGYSSISLDSSNAIFGRIRSSIEACVTMHILKGQVENLERIGSGQLYKFFIDLEMPLQLSLCDMEVYGFPANENSLRELFQQMMDTMKKLETKIYETHGSRFNLGSSAAVGRVVGLHRKANARISTSKQILEKIDSPIALMIVTYRKLSVTLSKTIQPLLRSVIDNRIRGQSITFTSTGRISMQEPNLQNVAKDFEVALGVNEKINISCRSSFFPPSGRCLVSADFCQLEMRILAHLSQDPTLLRVMNSEEDVFTAIAAKWNKIAEDSVSEALRNGTKQICYGIVYGMGMRSLAESLKCSEQEAMTVSEQFHAAYPGIRLYAEKVNKFARQNEYVETITGRRRYLDNINSGEPQLKSQAERQAVNSAIQGSAADIAKSAILRMEKNITRYKDKIGLTGNSVNLVLHLHDELIFEVPEEKAKKIAKVLSITMENCVRLSVPLKVKLKIGKSWGDLKEVKL